MQEHIKKPMILMLVCLAILFGGIFTYKYIVNKIGKHFLATNKPVVTVSTMSVGYEEWQALVKATGSVRAIQGVNVTTELAGLIQTIFFTPGSFVQKNTVLVQLNADADIARLQSLKANAELAVITYKRDLAQFAVHAVSKATVDTDAANVKNTDAQVREQAAIVAKKTIVAPFTGKLGISLINLGQYLNPGDRVVSLQSLDPIYVDFYVPQQQLPRLKTGQLVTLTTDAFPNKIYRGKVTTIDPAIDIATRNIQIEATLSNPKGELTPGMFAEVAVSTGKAEKYLTVPQAAVSFNPYGEIIYVVRNQNKNKNEQPNYVVHQAFVKTGDTRGDQIAILKGLKAGDIIVTSGQLKLKNNMSVAINNKIQPANNPFPTAEDET